MSEIIEEPLDPPVEEVPEEAPEPPEEEVAPAPEPKRGRGRPAGSKNKPKAQPVAPPPPPEPTPKPKPKPKVKKHAKPPRTPRYEEESSEDEEPSRGSAELDRNVLAAEVLALLQRQRHTKQQVRRDHYASWFQHMS